MNWKLTAGTGLCNEEPSVEMGIAWADRKGLEEPQHGAAEDALHRATAPSIGARQPGL